MHLDPQNTVLVKVKNVICTGPEMLQAFELEFRTIRVLSPFITVLEEKNHKFKWQLS